MDDATKSHDRSAALRLLIDTYGGDFAGVIRYLNGENTVETPHTTWKDAWEKRFDQTRCTFPFVIHTACDECLSAGMKSPTGQISDTYERLVKAAAPDLHEAVLRQNDYFRQTSRFRDDAEAS